MRFSKTRFLRRNRPDVPIIKIIKKSSGSRNRPLNSRRFNREDPGRNRGRQEGDRNQEGRRGGVRGKRRNDKKESKPEDLDRQLKNYWINQKDSSKSR